MYTIIMSKRNFIMKNIKKLFKEKLNFIAVIVALIMTILLYVPLRNELNIINDDNNIETKDLKKENYVFLGDSITDWYPIDELYEENVPIVNSGKAGYTTTDILEKLEKMVYVYNPTKVFILIGINDLKTDMSKDEILNNIEQIVINIKENRPAAKIYVQSIYPINKTENEKIIHSLIGKRENDAIIKMNKKLELLCKNQNITYINMYNKLIDNDGNLALHYTTDGLHLTNLGYLKVTKLLEKYINE